MDSILPEIVNAVTKPTGLQALLIVGGSAAAIYLLSRSRESLLIALSAGVYAAPLLMKLVR